MELPTPLDNLVALYDFLLFFLGGLFLIYKAIKKKDNPNTLSPNSGMVIWDFKEKDGKYVLEKYTKKFILYASVIFILFSLVVLVTLAGLFFINHNLDLIGFLITLITLLGFFLTLSNLPCSLEVDPQKKTFSIIYLKIFGKPKTDTYEFSQIDAIDFSILEFLRPTLTFLLPTENNIPFSIPNNLSNSSATGRWPNSFAFLILSDGKKVLLPNLSKEEAKFLASLIGCKFIESELE